MESERPLWNSSEQARFAERSAPFAEPYWISIRRRGSVRPLQGSDPQPGFGETEGFVEPLIPGNVGPQGSASPYPASAAGRASWQALTQVADQPGSTGASPARTPENIPSAQYAPPLIRPDAGYQAGGYATAGPTAFIQPARGSVLAPPGQPPTPGYPWPYYPKPKPPSMPGMRAAIAVMVSLSLVMLLGGFVAGALIQRSVEPETGYAGSTAGISYESLQRSVVRVSGEACRYEKFGTGFFADTGIVVTNAHVIAGVTNPWVELQVGTVFRSASATPVYYDPDQDIAVLRTSLAGDYLLMATRYPDSGSSLLAPGFPRGRGFEVKSASFVGVRQMRVESIYGDPQPPRSYVTVDSSLEPGNSGGPLLDTSGRVVGVATAVSVVQRDMAIAVPYERVERAVDIARSTYGPVSTGSCYTKDL